MNELPKKIIDAIEALEDAQRGVARSYDRSDAEFHDRIEIRNACRADLEAEIAKMSVEFSQTKPTKTEQGAMLFQYLTQVSRLLSSAFAKDQVWSYEATRLQAPDGSYLGTCLEDGCIITIRIGPPEKTPAAPPATPAR